MEDSACQVLLTDADDVLQPVPEHPVKSCKATFLFKQVFFSTYSSKKFGWNVLKKLKTKFWTNL